ncbi:MAG TPA: hypothetical protein VJP40_10160 [bacterium]|nr:hypothetical protein [bacterium]
MTWRLLFSIQILLFSLTLAPVARGQSGVGVGTFAVNGPKDQAYLSGAAQDAVVGALIKKGIAARSVGQTLDPDKLKSTAQGKGEDALLVAGRINIVGQTYRVLLKWVDSNGRVSQDYLEVAGQNQLLPSLETFAASRLQVPAAAPAPAVVQAPVVEKPKTEAKAEKVAPAPVPVPVPAAAPSQAPEKVFKIEGEPVPAPQPPKVAEKPAPRREAEPKISNKVEPAGSTQDYSTVSQRLPYEVRALAHADVDGDGQPEVLLTDQSDLFIYRQSGGDLQEIARYAGKKLDHFVKVDVMAAPQGGRPWIVLTNLRGSLAASKILSFEGQSIRALYENIDYQLRVVRKDGGEKLYGQAYRGDSSRYPVYEMKEAGGKIEAGEKLDIPTELGLYAFDYVDPATSSGFTLAGLTPSGKVKLFKEEKGKYKGTWTSRENYGGSANDVGVEIKDAFNEVVADYYIVPVRLQALPGAGGPQLVVAKNDALLKDVIGRKPVISDGRIVKLKWDPMGMEEAWSSKKVDGSILDYLVTSGSAGNKLLVAVRMRDQGFFEGVGKKKDSVLLVYDLN